MRSDATATPARESGSPMVDGCHILGTPEVDYADGAELAVLDIVASHLDVSSESDELARAATDWPTRYHLSTERANALRLMELAATDRVLEVGAGCGAITRYLGERCSVVDALEPVRSRARVAASRTRDLPGVRVFVGALDDIPAVPAYDVIIVWGVLEYVGGGRPEPEPYVDFLSSARARLLPGGEVVCAIENKLGVKYLCGSPEDHTGREFDSVEDYPRATRARTFDRASLEGLFREAGFLSARVLQAMPDYKFTRLVIGDRGLADERLRSIAWETLPMPSPDRVGHRWKGPDEGALWRVLVRAGIGNTFGNSFLVIAGDRTARRPGVWPDTRIAGFASLGRRRAYRVLTHLDAGAGDEITVLRRRSSGGGSRLEEPGIVHDVVEREAFIAAPTLAELIYEATDEATVTALIDRWRRAIDAALERRPDLLDLAAHNAKLVDDDLVWFDQEWRVAGWTPDERRARFAYLLAVGIMSRVDAETWPARAGVSTLGDLTRWILVRLGVDPPPSWDERLVEREATFGRHLTHADGDPAVGAALLRDQLRLPLEAGNLASRRLFTRGNERLQSDHALQTAHVGNLEAIIVEKDRLIAIRDQQLRAVSGSVVWRAVSRVRALRRRLSR